MLISQKIEKDFFGTYFNQKLMLEIKAFVSLHSPPPYGYWRLFLPTMPWLICLLKIKSLILYVREYYFLWILHWQIYP